MSHDSDDDAICRWFSRFWSVTQSWEVLRPCKNRYWTELLPVIGSCVAAEWLRVVGCQTSAGSTLWPNEFCTLTTTFMWECYSWTSDPHLTLDKLDNLGLGSTLCSWVMDLFTDLPHQVRIANHTSSTLILSTGTPLHCVLSPMLFMLVTHGWMEVFYCEQLLQILTKYISNVHENKCLNCHTVVLC